MPLAYAQSLKVVVKAEKVQFYQINYATYPAGTPIETYGQSPAIERFRADLDRAGRLISQAGTDVQRPAGPG